MVLRGIIVTYALNGVRGAEDFRVLGNQPAFFEYGPNISDCSVFVGDTRDVTTNHLVGLYWNRRLFPFEVVAEKCEETALTNRECSLFSLCEDSKKRVTSERKNNCYGNRKTNCICPNKSHRCSHLVTFIFWRYRAKSAIGALQIVNKPVTQLTQRSGLSFLGLKVRKVRTTDLHSVAVSSSTTTASVAGLLAFCVTNAPSCHSPDASWPEAA